LHLQTATTSRSGDLPYLKLYIWHISQNGNEVAVILLSGLTSWTRN